MKLKLVKHLLYCSAAVGSIAIAPFASAQAPAQPPVSPGVVSPPAPRTVQPPAATWYGTPLPETRGTVQRFTLTPIGELDGVMLADGTEVHLPPHLSAQLASAVRVGDSVIAQGYRSPSVPLVVAQSLTDTSSGQTVIDSGPPPPGFRPPPPPPGMPAPGAQQALVQGNVERPLYGPAGDVNGALLDDGTIVRIGPREAYLVASLLSPGQTLVVQGWGLTTAYGRVVEAQAVGPASGQMTPVAPPLPPGYAPPPGPVPR